MTTRLATDKGFLLVAETVAEVREKIKTTPDGFIEVKGVGGDLDLFLKDSNCPVTLNITDIVMFREKGKESHLGKV